MQNFRDARGIGVPAAAPVVAGSRMRSRCGTGKCRATNRSQGACQEQPQTGVQLVDDLRHVATGTDSGNSFPFSAKIEERDVVREMKEEGT